jgi:hypothetical protein
MTQAITIPVDAEIQQAFEQSSEEERQELQVLVSLFFKEGWAKREYRGGDARDRQPCPRAGLKVGNLG